MKRREFITFLGGGIAAWPLAAQAQQPERMRRVGMLVNFAEGDAEGRRRIDAFLKSMSELGWVDGKTFRIDYRWGVEAQTVVIKNAAELVALAPDVIVANAPPSVQALKQATQTIPLVFVAVTDPVALGIVQSLARPGGNATGFSPAELGMSPKWLQLLKEIVARREACGGVRGSEQYRRASAIRRDPERGTLHGCGPERDRCARRG